MADGRIVPQAFGRGTLPVLHPTCAAARVWAELGEHEGVAVGERITWLCNCVLSWCNFVIEKTRSRNTFIRNSKHESNLLRNVRMFNMGEDPFIKSSVPPETRHEPRARSVRRSAHVWRSMWTLPPDCGGHVKGVTTPGACVRVFDREGSASFLRESRQ